MADFDTIDEEERASFLTEVLVDPKTADGQRALWEVIRKRSKRPKAQPYPAPG